MKKALSLVLAILTVMALSVAASAGAVSTEIKNGTPVLDGVLDDIYTQSASFTLDNPGFYCWGDGSVDNCGNATAYFLWDADYLYVCVVAEDSTVFSAGPDADWQNDAAEMWFLDEDLKFKVHAAADGNFFLGADADGAVAWEKGFEGAKNAAGTTDDGWCIEVALPMNDLGAGKEFGFNLQVNDIYSTDAAASGAASGAQTPEDFTMKLVADQVVLPEPETEAPVADEVVDTAAETVVEAPKTFDAGIIAAVAAIVSAAGYAISKKH